MRAAARIMLGSLGAVCALLFLQCGDAVQADEGRDALLQVPGATFVRGAPPPSAGGPSVLAARLVTNRVRSGTVGKPVVVSLSGPATGAAIALGGDRGYWLVPAGAPLAETAGAPSVRADLGFAARLPGGPRELSFYGVDAEGRFGAPLAETVLVEDPAHPSGAVVVALSWSASADLDLRVVLPDGTEVGKANRMVAVPNDGGVETVGGLDFDSNASCIDDGRHTENVVLSDAVPRGRYTVRVDTYSLCGEPTEFWKVEARVAGVVVKAAEGTSTPFDERLPHGAGAGLLAFTFDVP